MPPEAGQVLHFSEDPTITEFRPHVAATAQPAERYVWAVDAPLAPGYWFPRQCPRAMAWTVDTSTPADRERILGPGGGDRVHAIEYGWLGAMNTAQLYAYRLPAADFAPFGEPRPHAFVATHPVRPLGPPERVGDLIALHEAAGIQLRVLPTLWEFWDAVVASTLDFSGIRLRNARGERRCAASVGEPRPQRPLDPTGDGHSPEHVSPDVRSPRQPLGERLSHRRLAGPHHASDHQHRRTCRVHLGILAPTPNSPQNGGGSLVVSRGRSGGRDR